MSSATFTGLKAGRPTFTWGSDVPPKWLVALSNRVTVKDGNAYIGAKALEPGDIIREDQHK